MSCSESPQWATVPERKTLCKTQITHYIKGACIHAHAHMHTHACTHTHILLTALFRNYPDLTEATVAVASAGPYASLHLTPDSRQTTTPAPHHSVFYRLDPFLPPNQQHQSTEGNSLHQRSSLSKTSSFRKQLQN